jgi:hypothetical protein
MIHLNIILPSMLGSLKWSLSLRFHYLNFVYASPLRHTCYLLRPSHSSRLTVMYSVWYCCLILVLTRLAVSRQTTIKKHSIKYHGNPCSGRLADTCGHTDRKTEGQ